VGAQFPDRPRAGLPAPSSKEHTFPHLRPDLLPAADVVLSSNRPTAARLGGELIAARTRARARFLSRRLREQETRRLRS
jgi:hypothetical protein